MKRQGWIALIVLCALLLPVTGTAPTRAAGELHVRPSASGSGDCSSWTNACTLQDALDTAVYGDEIWVAAGTYRPTVPIDPGDPRTATFLLVDGVALYGGFAGTETARGQRDWLANPTILSGDIGLAGDEADNSYHVVASIGDGVATSLDGFTLTAGNTGVGDTCPLACGGGLYADDSGLALSNLTFEGNDGRFGAGMYNDHGDPTLDHVLFRDNSALTGGGIYDDTGAPTLTDVTFLNNMASSAGGMSSNFGTPTLVNVTFSGNSASGLGGAMNASYSDLTLINVLFSGNTAFSGGGMYNWHSSPTLINVTFSQNSAENMGGGLLNSSDSDPALDNTILWGNTAPSGPQISNSSDSTPLVTYCDIQDSGGSGTGWDGGLGIDNGGNVDADPSFVDPSGPDGIPGTSDDNLRLRRISPAIDAASNLLIPAYVTTDLDGNARLVDTPFVADTGIGTPPIVDMGAYEFQSNLAYLPVVIVNR